MKKIGIVVLILLFLSSYYRASSSSIGATKEYLIMRVYHRLKNTEIISSIYFETGEHFPNSLKGKLENGAEGSIKVMNESGKILVLHNEVDVINYLASAGWNLLSSYPIQIADRSYVQYIFVKEK